MNSGLDKAIAAHKEDQEKIKILNTQHLDKLNEAAKSLCGELGLNPSWIKNGGDIYFAEEDVLLRLTSGNEIFRIGKCDICGEDLVTDWGRYPSLKSIGELIEDGNWRYHFCQKSTPEEPKTPSQELIEALDRYIAYSINQVTE